MSHRSFVIDTLTKVESHAKLDVEMEKGEIKKTKLEVYEAARYFEAMVRGRDYREAHTITQRVCGICSVIHTLTSLRAIENALGVKPSQQTIDLRKLLLYASQVHSHTAHLFFFALPDYLGFADAIELSKKKHDYIHLALDLQKLASDIVRIIGGRAIHPVSPRIGGFYSFPDKKRIGRIRENFEGMRKLSEKVARIFMNLKYPELESDSPQFALQDGKEYPLYEGMIANSKGFAFEAKDYGKHVNEEIRTYSNAKYSTFQGENYMVGALPRLNINHNLLSAGAKSLLKESRFVPPIRNPFVNNFAQALENVHFTEESLRILDNYANGMKGEELKVKPKESEGIAASEAPRGILYHHYRIGKDGKIKYVNIITPTSQNAGSMENDIRLLLPSILKYPDKKVKLFLEMLIRAYDPCFSCSTHFLEFRLKR
ncbi:MAG: Ni/Fe hydrogenase subunit alpha [Candidatus Aenigmatarchaeota archaeon]|nr:MAG: Ni/Fe hydrogenase subunit alpha [Candidatus Aenigmarchaeota archaeon]